MIVAPTIALDPNVANVGSRTAVNPASTKREISER
jgi:hypothetical protein